MSRYLSSAPTNGFLNDPKVAIPLPPALDKADNPLRMVGHGRTGR